mgnify:CR=1 FL=1
MKEYLGIVLVSLTIINASFCQEMPKIEGAILKSEDYKLLIDENFQGDNLVHKWYLEPVSYPLYDVNRIHTRSVKDLKSANTIYPGRSFVRSLKNWVLSVSIENLKLKDPFSIRFHGLSKSTSPIFELGLNHKYVFHNNEGIVKVGSEKKITITIINSVEDLKRKLYINGQLTDSVDITFNEGSWIDAKGFVNTSELEIKKGEKSKWKFTKFILLENKDIRSLRPYTFLYDSSKIHRRMQLVNSIFINRDERKIKELKKLVENGDRIANKWLSYFQDEASPFLGLQEKYTRNPEPKLLDILFATKGEEKVPISAWKLIAGPPDYNSTKFMDKIADYSNIYMIPVALSGLLSMDTPVPGYRTFKVIELSKRFEAWKKVLDENNVQTTASLLTEANNIYVKLIDFGDTTGFGKMCTNYKVAVKEGLITREDLFNRHLAILSSKRVINLASMEGIREYYKKNLLKSYSMIEIKGILDVWKRGRPYYDLKDILRLWQADELPFNERKATIEELKDQMFFPAMVVAIKENYEFSDAFLMQLASDKSSPLYYVQMTLWRIVFERNPGSSYAIVAKKNYEYESLYTTEYRTTIGKKSTFGMTPRTAWENRNRTEISGSQVTVRRATPFHPRRRTLKQLLLGE